MNFLKKKKIPIEIYTPIEILPLFSPTFFSFFSFFENRDSHSR
jgi:hypothetical protein